MVNYDIIIKGGTIVDGSGILPRYVSDLGIKDGKIAKIGGLANSTAGKVLDAKGLVVAPGFVDLHTHYDAQLYWDPYCSLSGWHGVTSVVIGNCGFGFAPCRPNDQDRAMLALTRTEAIPYDAMKQGMAWDWTTFPEFMDSLDRIPKAVNVNTLVPLTPIYGWVMGWDEAKKRRPTEAELKEMTKLVHEAMDAGGMGWSSQVLGTNSVQADYDGTPMITDLMTEEELIAFAKVLKDRDEGFMELTLAITDEKGQRKDDEVMATYERITQAAGRPMIFQAVAANDSNPDVHRKRLAWLEDCNRRGIPMYSQGSAGRQGIELTFEDWNLFDAVPSWREATTGSHEEKKLKMQDPDLRVKLREEYDSGMRPNVASVEGLMVMEVYNDSLRDYEGMTVTQIAEKEGKHVVDALLDVVVADDLNTEFLSASTRKDPTYSAEVMRSPYVSSGTSDGGAHVKFITAGSYPTDFLIWMVREEGALTLEQAHYKLSYQNAFFGGFKDRGLIREGVPADVVVYDLDKLKVLDAEVIEDLPGGEWRRIQRSEGYRWTIVNGDVTLEDGIPTGAMPGKLLRHGKA